ncbi:hypothetical protein AAMO2058_001184100 [Amorphochlora amoebiformis]
MRRALALVVFVVFIAVHIANIYPQGYLKTPVYRNQPVGISKTRVGRLGRKLRDCIRRDTFTHATIISPDGSEEPRARLELESGACVAFRKYSPEDVKNRVLSGPFGALKVIGRALQMAYEVSSFATDLTSNQGKEDNPEVVRQRASRLRETLSRLGPAFVKAGQVLANRPDILREDYMNELTKLQDDVPAFKNDLAFSIIEENLGRSLEEVFSEITPQPIAAASLGQVYKARLRETGELVAVKVQRPGVEPNLYRDLYIFRALAGLINGWSAKQLGCNAQLIIDEFGEKLLEELDYTQECRNIQDFYRNFEGDPLVKIPRPYPELCGPRVVTMEWIDGTRCTRPDLVQQKVEVDDFIRHGVVSGLRQLLEFGLFHADPHAGNIFALEDGRIAYVDFGNVAEISEGNKEILVDAVVHAVNEDYKEMAGDFMRLGFLAPGTDVTPIEPALESIWKDSAVQTLENFNFRTVTGKFNELVYQYPIRIPERYALVIRSLLTQEGICLSLKPDFKFLEVAYPYVAKRLLTDSRLRNRLFEILYKDGKFEWQRLENLIKLARSSDGGIALDLTETGRDLFRILAFDEGLRNQLIVAFTEGDRLAIPEVQSLLSVLQDSGAVNATSIISSIPSLSREILREWSSRILT